MSVRTKYDKKPKPQNNLKRKNKVKRHLINKKKTSKKNKILRRVKQKIRLTKRERKKHGIKLPKSKDKNGFGSCACSYSRGIPM